MVQAAPLQQTAQASGKPLTLPVIAMIAIFDRYNEPVIMRNYLAKHLNRENEAKLKLAEAAGQASEQDMERIRRAYSRDVETIEMQMAMLAYSQLDIFSEKSQIIADSVKTA